MLLIAGQDVLNAELFRFDLCSGRSDRVGDLARYSDLSAAGPHVVVANAASGPDRVAALRPSGDLTPLLGLSASNGSSPEIDTAGRVAFVQLTNEAEPFALRLVGGAQGVRTPLTSVSPLRSPAFGPRSLLAVAADPDETLGQSGPTLLILLDLEDGREVTRTELATQNVGALVWNERAELLAVQDLGTNQTLLVEPSSGRVLRRVDDWTPRAFTPDGTRLLLERGGGFAVLSLITGTDPLTPLPAKAAGEVAGVAFAPPSFTAGS